MRDFDADDISGCYETISCEMFRNMNYHDNMDNIKYKAIPSSEKPSDCESPDEGC